MNIHQGKLDKFIYWVNERENIRWRREQGLPAPWTDDPILQHHHFCNIRREDDRGTKEIRQVRVELDLAMHKRPEFYTLARLFNKADTVKSYWLYGIDHIKQLREEGEKLFHVAYVVSTCGERMDKVDYVARVVKAVRDSYVSNLSCRECFDCLRRVDGLGSFLAGQIVADLKNDQYLHYAPDWHNFAVMGPGSKKGLDILFGLGTTERNFTERLVALNRAVEGAIPYIHMQDLQNCLCEFQKFMHYVENSPGRRRVYVQRQHA
jgi:hypothetical protein